MLDKNRGADAQIDDRVDPPVACNASNAENSGVRTTVRITSPDGSFSPLPVATLVDGQTVELPKIYLILNDKETEIPDVRFVDTKTLEAVIDNEPPIAAGE